MSKKYFELKEAAYEVSGVRINKFSDSKSGFFCSFNSFSDFRTQLRSPIVAPIVGLTCALNSALNACRDLLETVINIACLDATNIQQSVPAFFNHALYAVYFAVSCLIDTVWDLVALATRSASTVVAGIAGTVNSVVNAFSEETEQRFFTQL